MAKVAWSADIQARGAASPVVADGKVFVLRSGGGFDNIDPVSLSAIDERTGTVLWVTGFPDLQGTLMGWASPAYSDGFVYVTVNGGTYKIDAFDGNILKTFAHSYPTCNGGPLVIGGVVFCCDWYGHYYCLDATTPGDLFGLFWQFDCLKGQYSQATPAYDNGVVYLTSWKTRGSGELLEHYGHVYAVDVETGTEIWSSSVPYCCCCSPCVAYGNVYVTTYNFYGDGELCALCTEDGWIEWHQPIQRSDCTPAVAYGNVYVTGGCSDYSDHQVYCFDALTGQPKWQTDLADDIGGWTRSIAIADGRIYVGRETRLPYNYDRTFCLDARTGEKIWDYPQGGATSPIHNGTLYTVGNNGVLYAFQAEPEPSSVDYLKGIFPNAKPTVFYGRRGIRQNAG